MVKDLKEKLSSKSREKQELGDALAKTCHKLADSKAQREAEKKVATSSLKECNDQKVAFSILTFIEGMNETWRKVTECLSDLNLSFLDEGEKAKAGPAFGVEEAMGPSPWVA